MEECGIMILCHSYGSSTIPTVSIQVERVVYRRVNPEDDRDRAEPIRDENSDMWKCAYCEKKYGSPAPSRIQYTNAIDD